MEQIKLRIHTWPEQILKKKCRPVSKIDERIRDIVDQMYSLLRIHEGIGLAANQVGIDLNIVIVDAKSRVFKLLNPKVIKKQGKIKITEGCLSFPGLELDVPRAQKVRVSAQDLEGQPVDIEAEDLLAVVLQHEIDHINGIPFIYRVSFWQRLKKYLKLKEIKEKTRNAVPERGEK